MTHAVPMVAGFALVKERTAVQLITTSGTVLLSLHTPVSWTKISPLYHLKGSKYQNDCTYIKASL